jgi:hypothetical protein
MKTNCNLEHLCSDESGEGCRFFNKGYCSRYNAWPEIIHEKMHADLGPTKRVKVLDGEE